MLSFKRESSSENYGPWVYFYHIIFRSLRPKTKKYLPKIYFPSLYFALLFIFYTYQISSLKITVKGLTTPLSRWVQVFLFVCVGAIIGDLCVPPIGLIPQFLTEGNTYLYFAASCFPLQGKNQSKLKK